MLPVADFQGERNKKHLIRKETFPVDGRKRKKKTP